MKKAANISQALLDDIKEQSKSASEGYYPMYYNKNVEVEIKQNSAGRAYRGRGIEMCVELEEPACNDGGNGDMYHITLNTNQMMHCTIGDEEIETDEIKVTIVGNWELNDFFEVISRLRKLRKT